jgi:hypothetical protein
MNDSMHFMCVYVKSYRREPDVFYITNHVKNVRFPSVTLYIQEACIKLGISRFAELLDRSSHVKN